ncbi:hypothetical protein, partial [Sulfitobacter sp. HI0023]|uniref:hypothetical protein n=1 Tax=Sulfitobacter sp. HI0023 TaxID=1822225 RepID=UPI001F3BF029
YRDISQQYAQGAIKAIILVNGGAAVAVLSQVSPTHSDFSTKSVGYALVAFVFGVAIGCTCWLVGFLSTRYVDRTLRGDEPNYDKANFWMHVGELLIISGVAAFLTGTLILACNLLSLEL